VPQGKRVGQVPQEEQDGQVPQDLLVRQEQLVPQGKQGGLALGLQALQALQVQQELQEIQVQLVLQVLPAVLIP